MDATQPAPSPASAPATLVATQPREANRRLALMSLAHGITHIRGAILPLIYPLLMTSMGFGYVELGALLSVTRMASGLLNSIWGTVARRVPGKYLIGGDNIGVGLGMVLVGLSHTYPELVGAVGVGQVAASPQHPIGNAMITRWFGKKMHGASLSIHWAGANVVTVLTPLLATVLIARVGWQNTLYLFSIPAFLVGLLILFTLPREMVRPKGDPKVSWARDFFAPLADSRVRLLIVVASVTAVGKGIGVLQTYVPLFLANELHLSRQTTGILFTLFIATSILGPLVTGRMSDRRDRPRFLGLLFLCSFVLSVALAALAHVSLWLLVPALVAFGLVIYSCSPIEQAVMADVTSRDLRAGAYSLFFSITAIIGALWPVVLGAVTQYFGFSGFFATVAASYVIAGVIYMRGDWSVPEAKA